MRVTDRVLFNNTGISKAYRKTIAYTMKIFFNKRFEEEVLSNEKLRTTILICMLLFAVIYLITTIALDKNMLPINPDVESAVLLLVFHCALLVFEISTLLWINHKIKKQEFSLEIFNRYSSSFIEICSPGVIIFIMAKQYNSPVTILHAPVVYLYFIFIILSTLRLDFRLSLFTGCMAAIGFFIISIVLIRESQVKKWQYNS